MKSNNNNNAQAITDVVNRKLPNGDIYTGEMMNGVPNGQGSVISYVDSRGRTRDGDVIGEKPRICVTQFKGEFECGHLEGHGVEIKSDGTVLEGNFWAGKKVGNFFTTDSSGMEYKQLYYFDRLDESTPADLSAESTTGNLLHTENLPNNQDTNITNYAAIEHIKQQRINDIKQQNQDFQR